MKVFVMVEMEGISGIVKESRVFPDQEHYQTGRNGPICGRPEAAETGDSNVHDTACRAMAAGGTGCEGAWSCREVVPGT